MKAIIVVLVRRRVRAIPRPFVQTLNKETDINVGIGAYMYCASKKKLGPPHQGGVQLLPKWPPNKGDSELKTRISCRYIYILNHNDIDCAALKINHYC